MISFVYIKYMTFVKRNIAPCRLRQYYESKVLHNTEVTWFSTFRHSPKSDRNCKKSHSAIHNASFGTFKAKIGGLYIDNECLNFLENCDFSQFWSKIVQFSISQETLGADFAAKNWQSLMKNRAKFYWIKLFLNDRFIS